MDTPNRNFEMTKQSWHKPQAYILRGAAAGGGDKVPGGQEQIKGTAPTEDQYFQNAIAAS